MSGQEYVELTFKRSYTLIILALSLGMSALAGCVALRVGPFTGAGETRQIAGWIGMLIFGFLVLQFIRTFAKPLRPSFILTPTGLRLVHTFERELPWSEVTRVRVLGHLLGKKIALQVPESTIMKMGSKVASRAYLNSKLGLEPDEVSVLSASLNWTHDQILEAITSRVAAARGAI
jgi:hypothetical protein